MTQKERLERTKYVVEATRFETLSLWREYHDKYSWEDLNDGYHITVGHLVDMPVCISIHWIKLNGMLIMFYEPTSQVVDHRMIDTWLDENCDPRNGSRKLRIDAMNFHQCISYISDGT